MYIIFDTETTGLPKNFKAPITDTDNWPRCIQIAWQLHDEWGTLIESKDYLVKPEGFNKPYDAEQIHGISTELAEEQGVDLQFVLEEFNVALGKAKFVVGQNVMFDNNVMGCEYHRFSVDTELNNMKILDTMSEKTATLCQLPGGRGGKFKLPTLTELHKHLFGEGFGEAHNATADVEATTRCFLELIRVENYTEEELDCDGDYIQNFLDKNPEQIQFIGLTHLNLKAESAKIKARKASTTEQKVVDVAGNTALLKDATFSHLHNHSQFSILQSTITIKGLVKQAIENNSDGVALTDTGNMMAAFHFVREVLSHNKGVEGRRVEAEENGTDFNEKPLMPIVGCEFNICEDHLNKKVKDNGYQVVILAKNEKGYHNLAKMSSIAFTHGKYYVPRIDKKVVEQYKEDLIVLTGNIYGEVPSKISKSGSRISLSNL